jgi:hypothetical protein
VLLYCHAGCEFDEIVRALQMEPHEFFRQNRSRFRARRSRHR